MPYADADENAGALVSLQSLVDRLSDDHLEALRSLLAIKRQPFGGQRLSLLIPTLASDKFPNGFNRLDRFQPRSTRRRSAAASA